MKAGRIILFLLAVLTAAVLSVRAALAGDDPSAARIFMPDTEPASTPATAPSSEEQVADLQKALGELQQGHIRQAEALARRLGQEDSPLAPKAWIIVAAARLSGGDYASARQAYERFLADCGDADLRAYVSGQIEYCARGGPLPAAEPPSRLLTPLQRRALAQVDSQLHTASSEHFIVQSNNAQLSALVLAAAESALKRISVEILHGSDYPHCVQITVLPSAREYRSGQSNTGGDYDSSQGRFELARDEYGQWQRAIFLTQLNADGQFDTQLLDRTLPHELCHLVVTEWFGDSPCPLYLHEGLAMLAECGNQDARLLQTAAAAAKGAALPLEQLLARDSYPPAQMDLFYAESYCLVSYLRRNLSDAQFSQCLERIKEGCSLRDALLRTLLMVEDSQMMRQFEQAWLNDSIEQAQYLLAVTSRPAK